MDAHTHITLRSASRRLQRPYVKIAAEIFKKTSCVPGLKPDSRDVAKDMIDLGGTRELMKALDRRFNAKLTDKELAARRTGYKPRATNHKSGALWNDARQIEPAGDGAVTRRGMTSEKHRPREPM